MIAFLIAENIEILRSLASNIQSPKLCFIQNESIEAQIALIKPSKEDFIFLFDLNNPQKDFEKNLIWVQTSYPSAPIWAIFDSKSESLTYEVLRLGFHKIVSYYDNIPQLLKAAENK